MCEQEPLGFDTPAKAGQGLVRANDPVAGNHNRQRVCAVGTAHGTARGRASDACCQRAIRDRLAEGDVAQRAPNLVR